MSQDQLFIWKSSLGGPISWVGWSLWGSPGWGLARLMESQTWHQPAGSVALSGEYSEKGQWPVTAFLSERKLSSNSRLIPDTLVSPCMPLVPFKLLPLCWSSEGVSLSKSMHESCRKNCLGVHEFLSSTTSIPAGFYSQELWGLLFLAVKPWAGGPGGAGTTCGCMTNPFHISTPPTSFSVASSLIP